MADLISISPLQFRRDFIRARKGKRAARDSLIVESCPTPQVVAANKADMPSFSGIRVGFTCTKKIGNAVRRNRTKRRLRAAARDVLSRIGNPGTDYVIIGRAITADVPFEKLIADLEGAIAKIHRPQTKPRQMAGNRSATKAVKSGNNP